MTRFKKCDNEFCNNVIKPPYNILRLSDPRLGGHKVKKDLGYGRATISNRTKKLRLCSICHEAELQLTKEQGSDPVWFPDQEQKIVADEKAVVKK